MDKSYVDSIISKYYLDQHPECIFVFGDNVKGKGTKGAAQLRYHPQSVGFVTKKYPNYDRDSYFKPKEYLPVFQQEISKLIKMIEENPDKTFLISKLGAGLANRFKIYERVIREGLQVLTKYDNVKFLFDLEE